MASIIGWALAQITKESARLTKNLSQRVSRIEQAGTTTKAAERFRELQNAPKPKTRNEALSRLAELKKIDESKGTRVATAGKQAAVEERRAQRQATQEALIKNPRAVPDGKKLDDLYNALKQSVSGKVKRVKADPKIRSTPATDAYDEWLANQTKNPTKRQKAAQTRRLIEINNYQGITVKGARIQHQRGVEAFGPDYETWTKEQQAAAWEGFRDLADRMNTSLSSHQVLVDIKAATLHDTLKVSFFNKTVDDGRGGKKQVMAASVAPSLQEAQREAAQKQYRAERLAEMVRLSGPRKRLM